MNLIHDQIRPYFPKFSASLVAQTPSEREQGRCAVIEFGKTQKHQVKYFTAAAELEQYLASPKPDSLEHTKQSPLRRLFLLEDLPCNFVVTLGSRFRIPPSFFAGHWADPSSSAYNHRSPFQRCALPHFRLRYATSNRVEVDLPASVPSTEIYELVSRVSRHLVTYIRGGLVYDEAKSHHSMSFWSSRAREDVSWDAVLLVDPAPGSHVRCMTTGALYPLCSELRDDSSMPKRFLNPELDLLGELSEDSSQWAAAYSVAGYRSMFDDTLQALCSSSHPIVATHSPLSVVEAPRKLVVSLTIAYLRRRYMNLVSIQNSSFRPQVLRNNYLASFSKNSYSNWSSEFFDFIVGSRAAMRVLVREMDDNAAGLGLEDPDYAAPQWERDGWQSVKDLMSVVEETVEAFADGYMQYVTIQEARVASGNAQSLSRITVLTMLFIPLSTVASIFSMGGEFLPGQPRSWVFWTVAIPLLMVLSYLYWRQVIVRMVHYQARSILPLYEKKVAKQ